MPVAQIVFPHPPDAVAVARSGEDGRLAVERVSPGDWLQVGRRLFGGGQVPVGVASPSANLGEVVVFLASESFDALAWDADGAFALCAARSGERLALALQPEPSAAALVLMDDEVRALAAGAQLMVGEAAEDRRPARLDRATTMPLPLARVRGVVEAVDLL